MSRRKRSFRWVRWLVFLILVVSAVTVIVLVKNNFDNKTKDDDRQSVDVNQTEEKKTTENSRNEEEKSEGEKVPQYDGESPNKSEALTGLISYADVVNDELVIRVNIDQFLQSGNCNLTMSRNGVTYYVSSVAIQASVTTSTCDGYKIPVSELSKGDFSVEIDLDSDGKSGKITGRVRI